MILIRNAMLVLMSFIISITVVACSPINQSKESAESKETKVVRKEKEKNNLRSQVQKLVTKNNADFELMNMANKSDNLFTIHLQEALLEPLPRPTLLVANICDVIKSGGAYFVTAVETQSEWVFQLECNESQARYVLSTATNDDSFFDYYAFVIVPKSINKSTSKELKDSEEEKPYIEDSEFFTIKGTCLDVVVLEGDIDVTDLFETKATHEK